MDRVTTILGLALSALAVPAPAASAVIPVPVAVYHMEEAEGPSLIDRSSYNNHGTLEGEFGRRVAGYVGHGVRFNGKDTVARIRDDASLNPGKASFTLSVAFKIDHKMTGKVDFDLVRKGLHSTTGGDYKLELNGRAERLQVGAYIRGRKGEADLSGGPRVNDGKWHTASVTRAGNALILKVDGQVVDTERSNVGKVANSEPLTIGGKPRIVKDSSPGGRDADWFRGVLDEVKLTVMR